MGLLDLPAPLFDLVDNRLQGILPPVVRLVLWAVVAAIASLAIYRWLSPQRRIAEIKAAALDARRRLNAHDGDFDTALPLMRRSIALSLRHVGLALPAVLVASLPVLALLVWLEGAYGYSFPIGHAPTVTVEPQGFTAAWRATESGGEIALTDGQGAEVAQLTVDKPITRVEKRQWWNVLIGNPAGYLPAEAPVDGVTIALPERQYLPVGPAWLRSWLVVALAALLITSLAFMRIARIA